jgi:Holliday junction resolvase-like predicted endonuclease
MTGKWTLVSLEGYFMSSGNGDRNRRQGIRAERIAEKHLRSIGYRPLGRNLVVGGVEIDLLMRDRSTRELVVVEVKSSRLGVHQALGALNVKKRRRIARAVRTLRRMHLSDGDGIRVEGILIDMSRNPPGIRHLA